MQTTPQQPGQASAQEVEGALRELRTLNVLDRLRGSCGVILEEAEGERECTDDERVARNYLADLPLKLRLRGLELYAETIKIGKTCPCPECFQALPTSTQYAGAKRGPLVAILQHLHTHVRGEIAEVATRATDGAKPFLVSASRLGTYFDMHCCERWLYRRSLRAEAACGHVTDVGSMFDVFGSAHTTRGTDFEKRLCERLGTDGMPVSWGAHMSDPAATAAPVLTFGAGAKVQRIRFMSEVEWASYEQQARASGAPWPPVGVGKLIDLKLRAHRQCACPTCLSWLRGEQPPKGSEWKSGCSFRDEETKVSDEALRQVASPSSRHSRSTRRTAISHAAGVPRADHALPAAASDTSWSPK